VRLDVALARTGANDEASLALLVRFDAGHLVHRGRSRKADVARCDRTSGNFLDLESSNTHKNFGK
jgi:hypothetical protein